MAEAFGIAASALAVTELAAKTAVLCTEYWNAVSSARADIERIRNEVTNLSTVAEGVRQLMVGPRGPRLRLLQKLDHGLQAGQSRLRELLDKLESSNPRSKMRRFGFRALKWPFQSQDVERVVHEIARCEQMISAALQVDQTAITLDVDEKATLGRLPIAQGAAFDSRAEEHNPTCLPDTRVDLLDDINAWIQDSTGKAVFWLNGMAGTGKSTISRTLARSAHESGYLGASFFFKRGESGRGDISKFFPTIMAQFATREPAIIPYLKDAIDLEVYNKAIPEQFSKLMLNPLLEVKAQATQIYLIVVDALDECDNDKDVELLIQLLSKSKQAQVKVFLTSRPELPIRHGFKSVQGTYDDLILHDIAETVVQRDMQIFLKHELTQIRDDYNKSAPDDLYLLPEWPDETIIQTLASMAAPLFIFAATVCRFIGDTCTGDPKKQLQEVLHYQTKSQISQLDATYLPVLDRLAVNSTSKQKIEIWCRFKEVVGSIVNLANPLSVSALAQLLEKSGGEIHAALRLLHSVLKIPTDGPVTLFHVSFGDFLMDPEKRNKPFWIDKQEAHTRLAKRCLRIMTESLRTDICGLGAPGTVLSDINPQQISSSIHPAVEYACRHWTYHLRQSGIGISDSHEVYSFLTTHFLHWLEVLCLTSRHTYISELANSMKRKVKWLVILVAIDNSSNIMSFLYDALQFIQVLYPPTSGQYVKTAAPLQIYCSALNFTPRMSIIRSLCKKEMPQWILPQPEVEECCWACIRRNSDLEGHKDWANVITFSPNGNLVASVYNNKTVQIWSVKSDAHQQTLESPGGAVISVSFSLDNRILALGLSNNTARLWHIERGAYNNTLQGHSGMVSSIKFSPDNSVLASGSFDKTIHLWDVGTGSHQQTLQGHADVIISLAFSPTRSLLASGSSDNTVRLWDLNTGSCQRTFEGHDYLIRSVGFSPDSTVLASASSDKTIRFWEVATSECLRSVELDTFVTEVSFSDDGMSLVIDIGTIAIAGTSQLASPSVVIQDTASLLRSANPDELSRLDLGYGISGDSRWTTRHGQNLLLLPSDDWVVSSAIRGSVVAIGGRLGRVVIMKFTEDSTS